MSAQPESFENSSFKELPLTAVWQLTSTEPGDANSPDDLIAGLNWQPAIVPGTVAMALNADIDTPAPYDERDWWYRTVFALDGASDNARHFLHCEGLATIAEVWLNGVQVLTSRNMFVGHRIDVSQHLRANNSLVIAFRALKAAPHPTRPRARWRTGLVERQNLRWFRTTLLGRIPGWTPQIDPVGPWRGITLDRRDVLAIGGLDLQVTARNGQGQISLHAQLEACGGGSITSAKLRLGDTDFQLELKQGPVAIVSETIDIGSVPLWWPHTHGVPNLVFWSLNAEVDGRSFTVATGRSGFKEITLDPTDDKVQFIVNGVPVFCRGACWITGDILALHGDREKLRALLILARGAGLNMLRVSGTATYESDDFYSLCDELGILVWQDFMFANMDYPFKDASFYADVDAEVSYQLLRTQRHACIAAYCGGSEVAQQAAMMGLPNADWLSDFFATELPARCAQLHAGIPYFPNTPWGGALPFHVATGISHYYGVGAYLRPIADVKSAGVKFTTECLGFSNVPEPETMKLAFGNEAIPPHHPNWKRRQPRDSGAGWDFEDVRDHYLKVLFPVDPFTLRSTNVNLYYQRSRIVTGEIMKRVFAEWRNPARNCGGGLVWFLVDIVPGAGWGLIDSTACPKSSYWYLKRCWAACALNFIDDGLDGLSILLSNEGSIEIEADLQIDFLMRCNRNGTSARIPVRLPAKTSSLMNVDELLGHFADSTYAYRFGPPSFDCVTARLEYSGSDTTISSDFYFPISLHMEMQVLDSVHLSVVDACEAYATLEIQTDAFLCGVRIVCPGFLESDNYFHLAPGERKKIFFERRSDFSNPLNIELLALNLLGSVQIGSNGLRCTA